MRQLRHTIATGGSRRLPLRQCSKAVTTNVLQTVCAQCTFNNGHVNMGSIPSRKRLSRLSRAVDQISGQYIA
jgi:hypothetical protein